MASQGSRRRSEYGEGDGIDRLSNLPEELLLLILGCLTRFWNLRAAARTSVLSRRWRHLWKGLPGLAFNDVDPESVDAVLAQQVTRPVVGELCIIFEKAAVPCPRASSILRAAEQLAPESFAICVDVNTEKNHCIELPCFGRTVSLYLDMVGVRLRVRPPPSGQFTMLERLSLNADYMNPATLLPMCPFLRDLSIGQCRGLDVLTVHSASLEVLSVSTTNSDICRIDINAPVLKDVKVNVYTSVEEEFTVLFSAPTVNKLDWVCHGGFSIGFGIWRLERISERKLHGSYVVSLCIESYDSLDAVRSFAQEMSQLPKTNFSTLELELHTGVHAYGSLVLHLLRIHPVIQRLKVVLAGRRVPTRMEEEEEEDEELCTEDCPCRQPVDWKSETLSLPDLEEVLISYDFKEGNEEVDFLKLLFRCAPGLKRMDVQAHGEVYDEICSICQENPHVKCDVSYGFYAQGPNKVVKD